MKVSIITIIDNTNYGTYLQALATGMAIMHLGHKAEIVYYTRECMTPKGRSKAILQDRGVLRWFYRCVLKSSRKTQKLRKKDILFLKKYIPITHEYVGFDELKANPPKADVYLTGSDQVWNSFYNRGVDKSFYVDYAPEGAKRISYAASIGMPEFPSDEVEDVKGLLKKYHAITVREIGAKEILAKLGIASQVVLDPTLLLNKSEWAKIAEQYPFGESEEYLLTYSVEYGKEDSYIKHYAKQIADKRGLKLYHITYGSVPRDNYYDKVFSYATPDQFLNLMLHASFIVVSSFHGTAFSINFNKPFITVSPKKFNSRVQNLLKITGLESRGVTDASRDVSLLGDIDYAGINEILSVERKKSLDILREMVNNNSANE